MPDEPQTVDATALTAKMMDYYKLQRDRVEIQNVALNSRLTIVQAENQVLTERIAKLEAAASGVPVAPPEQPAAPVKSKKGANHG